MDPELVDRIYESSFMPELWPGVLDELGRTADAVGGTFFVANTKVVSWTPSSILRDGMEKFAKSDIVARGQRGKRVIAARHAGFLTEHDLYPDPDERRADPYYSESLFPGGGLGAGTAIPLPNGDVIFLTWSDL